MGFQNSLIRERLDCPLFPSIIGTLQTLHSERDARTQQAVLWGSWDDNSSSGVATESYLETMWLAVGC